MRKHIGGQVVALDGKCLRRSHDGALGKHAITMVSAWASANHLVLGQRQVACKSNEITALPALLRALDVTDCIVTIDVMGTQKALAAQIVDQGGDYVLALKGNQPHLLEDVRSLFAWADALGYEQMRHAACETVNKGHGRIETRTCTTLSDPACLAMLADQAAWAKLQTVMRVRGLDATRSHWGIENRVHWVLDVAFREDDCRVCKGHGDANFAILRHIALNLLRQDTQTRVGIHGKRLKAGWDTAYLEHLLTS